MSKSVRNVILSLLQVVVCIVFLREVLQLKVEGTYFVNHVCIFSLKFLRLVVLGDLVEKDIEEREIQTRQQK